MVVIDEIHHCRNTGTISRRVASALADCADGVVGLSATPVHLSSENLFRLLEALDQDSFPNQGLFDERVAANRNFVEAERMLRAKAPNDALRGGDARENAAIVRSVLGGTRGPARDVVLLNAGAALFIAGTSPTLRDGMQRAGEAIDCGLAAATLDRLVALSAADPPGAGEAK